MPTTRSLIADVEAIVLRVPPDATALDGSSETLLVRVVDEEGRVGIGEADAPAVAARELVLMEDIHAWSRGLAGVVRGRDPLQLGALQAELYQASNYYGRRGLGVHALSALDIALHDLAARQLERPVYDLLGGPRRAALVPYATIYAGPVAGRTVGQMMDHFARLFETALAAGFRALKFEVLFEDLVSDRELVQLIREGRALVGAETTLMIDCGYRWHDWRAALWTLSRVEECDLYFVEAALQHDDLDGHARLAERIEPRLGGMELGATVWEAREWLERGRVDVLQPNIGRCGGLTEIRRIAALAELHGASVIPHGWKTGITQAVSRHFQAATPNVPYIEMFHPDLYPSPLRAELTRPEPQIVDGRIALPAEPGLGIEVVPEAVERYRVA
jgi:L-rhamnonate dehydratase